MWKSQHWQRCKEKRNADAKRKELQLVTDSSVSVCSATRIQQTRKRRKVGSALGHQHKADHTKPQTRGKHRYKKTSAFILPAQWQYTADICRSTWAANVTCARKTAVRINTDIFWRAGSIPGSRELMCKDGIRCQHWTETHTTISRRHTTERSGKTMGKICFPTGYTLGTSDPSRWRLIRTLLALL